MRWRFRSSTLILLYHRVARLSPDPWDLCVTPEHFAEHLEILSRYRRTRLDELKPGSKVGKRLTVAITFDDGYADNLHEAAPLLKQYDTPATFFITTGSIGQRQEFWWDELERIVFQAEDYQSLLPAAGITAPDGLSKEDVYLRLYWSLQALPNGTRRNVMNRLLTCSRQSFEGRPTHRTLTSEETARLGSEHRLFEIGAHTVTHPLLAAQPLDVQKMELADSKKRLETLLSREVQSCSYPFGGANHYTAETVQLAKQIGYRRACTTVPRAITKRDEPLEWGRFSVRDMGGEQFENFLFA
jgi:peptidoglycan/xylan/chitin deacetylase (PgdA/CDA1 family)